MRTYHHDAAPLAYASPDVNLLTLGLAALVLGGVLGPGMPRAGLAADVPILGAVVYVMARPAAVALGIGVAALIRGGGCPSLPACQRQDPAQSTAGAGPSLAMVIRCT